MVSRHIGPRPARNAEHSIVYRKEDEFCGWQFTSGFWETAEGHFVAGLKRDKVEYRASREIHHDQISKKATYEVVLVRSEDRGKSWLIDDPVLLVPPGLTEEDIRAQGPQDFSDLAPIDFTDRNVLVASYSAPRYGLVDSKSWVRISKDGGRSWSRMVLLPTVGLPALSATNASLVRHDGRSLIFLFSVSPDGWTRRPIVYASLDDGSNWTYLSHITPKYDDGAADGDWKSSFQFGGQRWFYPTAISLPDGRILCSLRCQRDPTGVKWTEIFESADGGLTWKFLSRVNDWGASAPLVRMDDGRIVCVYGYRLPPYGVRAKVSEDEGKSWGSEIILRDDGGSWDLGYPSAVRLDKDRVLAVYYFNSKDDPIQMNGGVRHVAQTIFTPD